MNDFVKIEELCNSALQISLPEREKFLRKMCGDDLELLEEVQSLLAFEENAADFIETPPGDIAALIFSDENRRNLTGKKILQYKILEPLGKGGMGEVYLADDTKLGRKVALKLLPPQFSEDEARLNLFEREARAISTLNHPNIITIYNVEEFENLNFIATEFIEGKTLRELISEKTLSIQETIEITVQVASALESAHSVGIIHRDIKPANIMIRKDGLAKVLDFGLAKIVKSEELGVISIKNSSNSSVITSDIPVHQTNHSLIMGTLNYMSPEQIQNKPLDERTDIFSLGVVMYEMLTGIQPFAGDTDEAVFSATINSAPKSLRELNPKVPAGLEKIIRRALEKDVNERYQTVKDLRNDLQRLKDNKHHPSVQTKILFPMAAVFTFSFLGIMAYFFFFNQLSPVPNFNYTQLTSQSGEELFPNLSPDGKSFLYSSRESGNWDIYLKQIGETTAINLTKDSAANEKQAVFSPDGQQIAFRSERNGGGIFVMSANGENVRQITNIGFYPNWSPDGKELVYCFDDFSEPGSRTTVPSQLWKVKVETGEKNLITEQDAVQPSWSPNGKRIAFWAIVGGQRDILTISADGGETTAVTNDAATDWNPVWSNDGKYLYYVSNRSGSMNLWRVAIDENSGKVSGNPEAITIPSNYSQLFNFSRDGKSFAYVQTVNYSNIFKVDFDSKTETVGKIPVEITTGSKITTNPELSPDNQLLAFDGVGDKQEDIFVAKADGSEVKQLTNDVYKDRTPHWSPDGKRLAFFTDASGKYEGYVMNADGSGRKMVTKFPDNSWAQFAVWSPDGKKVLFNSRNGYPIIFDPDKDGKDQTPQYLPEEGTKNRYFMASSWSSDGKKLIGYARDAEKTQSFLMTFDFTTNKYEIVNDFGTRVIWLADNRRIILYSTDKIFLLDTVTKRKKVLLSVAPNRIQTVTPSNDNRTIYYSVQKSESDIWLANTQ